MVSGLRRAARCIGNYVNTGTWIDQVVPPPGLIAGALSGWLDELRQGQVPLWNGHPVATMDENGPRLLRWDGHILQAWADPIGQCDLSM